MMVTVEEFQQSNEFTVGAWLVTSKAFHPIWHQWGINLVHLRGEVDGKLAVRINDEMTHEVGVLTIHPDLPIKADHEGSIPYLSPPDQVIQFKADSDEEALARITKAVDMVRAGSLSPDRDYRVMWEELLGGTSFLRRSI